MELPTNGEYHSTLPYLLRGRFVFIPFSSMTDITRPIFSAFRVLAAVAAVTVVMGFLFMSCDRQETVIPQGAQTLTGVLLPVPLSLSRRGSHALLQNGHQTALVESATVNLRDLEGVDIVIVGHFEQNTDRDALPVLVASGVTLLTMPMRTWQLPVQKISFDVPLTWNPSFYPEGARFTQTGGTVFLAASASTSTSLPVGNRISAGGRPAVLVHGTGAQTLYVQNGVSFFMLEFAEHVAVNDALILRIIRSIHFNTSSASSSATVTASGSTTSAGIPCGGSAGILCPAGQYCEITDSEKNIGRCRAVKR